MRATCKSTTACFLCADPVVHRELRALAEEAEDAEANLFGLGGHGWAQGGGRGEGLDGYTALYIEFKKLQRQLPKPLQGFSPHWLQHSHAIHALRSGIDLVSVQRQLGHESLSTTAVYLRYAGMDEARYLSGFTQGAEPVEHRDCPACGFTWRVDTRTGALTLDDQLVVMRRHARAR